MKKEKIVTLGLILMMIFLIGAIFYFSYLLMEAPTEEKTTSAVAPKKTKAQVATSEKFIALNQNSSSNPSPTSYLPTPTPTQTPTDNLVIKEKPFLKANHQNPKHYFLPMLFDKDNKLELLNLFYKKKIFPKRLPG